MRYHRNMNTLSPYQHGLLHGVRYINLFPVMDMEFLNAAMARYATNDKDANAWIKGQSHGMAFATLGVISFMLVAFFIIITNGSGLMAIIISIIGWAGFFLLVKTAITYDREFLLGNV